MRKGAAERTRLAMVLSSLFYPGAVVGAHEFYAPRANESPVAQWGEARSFSFGPHPRPLSQQLGEGRPIRAGCRLPLAQLLGEGAGGEGLSAGKLDTPQ